MSLRFKICLAAWIAVVAVAAVNQQASGQEFVPIPSPGPPTILQPGPELVFPDDGWVLDIRPALKVKRPTEVTTVIETAPPVVPEDSVAPEDAVSGKIHEGCGRARASAAEYVRVYESIPFNRAEYNVNPSYRHDSAMEILTGNARHQTVVRHSTTRTLSSAPRRPATPAYNPAFNPYAYGYLRPALRLNYYRYFPSLNPYMNIWNLTGAF